MALSIHYKGRIKNAMSLPLLIEEVKDIAKIYGWKYRIHEKCFPNNSFVSRESFQTIYGISFTPPECETISLTFLSNGVIVCPSRIAFFANSQNESEKSYVYTVSVKTQYAGIVVHQLIVNLFKYLNDKYLQSFEMNDESLYWETGDENQLREKFKEYDSLLDNFSLSMQTFPIKEGETIISYFDRLLEHINKLKES